MKGLLKLIGVFLIITSPIVAYAQLPSQGEYDALMALYSSTNGSGWTNKTGWSTANPAVLQSVSGFYGVTVDGSGHVMQVDLHGNNLTGTLPSQIGGLTNATLLYLYANSITGTIPDEIEDLSNVLYLALSNNQLSGELPDDLDGLVHLQQLNLSHNQLEGAIPACLGELTDLHEINFSVNEFTSLPVELSNATTLAGIDVSQNELTGSIPSEYGNLTGLVSLTLWGNSLSGNIPTSLGNLTNLQYLILGINQLTGSIPSELGNLTALKQLGLSSNQLSGAIPSSLGLLVNLETLNLATNNLTSLPVGLGTLTKVTTFDLSHNDLAGSIASDIGGMHDVVTIDVSDNQLTGSIPTGIGSLTNLQTFYAWGNQLTGVPSSIVNATSLHALDLTNNQISGTIPVIPSLASLAIGGNKLTFSGFVNAIQGITLSPLLYSSQATIDVVKNVVGQSGGSLTLTTTIDRSTSPASVYRWFKKIGGVDTPLNSASTTGHTVVVNDIDTEDEGTQYFYTITNTAAPSLTLTSNLQTLHVIVCDPPAVSFVTAVDSYTYTFTPTVTDAESCTTSYLWDFGDGQTSPDATSSHVFNTTGTYLVSLTLSYKCGECDSTAIVVQDTVEVSNTSICTAIYCDGYGNVGIGTMHTQGFRLSVDGKIRASEIIKVYPQGQWSDFVFEDKYRLRPLSEVETFIKTNGHLPDIPSAKEVEKEGVELGSMDAKLLQKIEELTLYMIESKRKTDELEVKLDKMMKENVQLKEQVTKSKKSRQ
jgi:Leucine-rich repeat (LRR) protein